MTTTNDIPLRLAVFDCDGTLVDSQHSIIHAMHAASDRHGFDRPGADAVRRVVGLPLEIAMQHLFGVDARVGEDMCLSYKSAFFALREGGAVSEPLYPGVSEVLDSLDRAGWLMGIATGKSMRGLVSTLNTHGLSDRFVTLQTSDVAHGKPHPDMMFKAMSATGAEPGDTVMIGDTT
ncbi:MAG: HAD-IA family hydrolase, partial [Alphaproteobacteria bacterium]|nr:HAD-IA family hydrolase [Alphaproteobacteria bacterium]